MTGTQRKPHLPGLDLVRLAAALVIPVYHFCIECALHALPIPSFLTGRGMADLVELALAVFFLLSGAALCWQWQGRFTARRYWVSRAAGVYPMFWLGWGALFLYGEVLHGNNPTVPRWRAVFSLVGLDGYLAPLTPTFYKIGEWFLGVILLLYLVFPLLLKWIPYPALGVGLAVLQLVWPALCPAPLDAWHTVLGRLPAFALGVWFGTLLSAPPAPRRWLWGLLGLPAAWLLPHPLAPWRPVFLLAASAAVFWALFAAGQRLRGRMAVAVRWLAGQTYGLFLVHHVFLTLIVLPFMAARPALPWAAVLPVYLILCFLLAALLRLAAAPLGRFLRRFETRTVSK